MKEKMELFKRELLEALEKLPQDRELLPSDIRVLADIASIYVALCELAEYEHDETHHAPQARTMPKDEIVDELDSAEAKYAEYRKSGEHPLLEMARDELRHAAFYLGRARMSPDVELRERLPAYQARLDELERMRSGSLMGAKPTRCFDFSPAAFRGCG